MNEAEYDKGLEALLAELFQQYTKLIQIHRDKTYLNVSHDLYRKTMAQFSATNEEVFEFKNAWSTIEKTLRKKA